MSKIKAKPPRAFEPPRTVSNPDYLKQGSDAAFRETIYALAQGAARLSACREAFGRAIGLTGTQFAVLIGVAYRQGHHGVTVRDLSKHIALASTHVTTEVGRLIDAGLLVKRPNDSDRRSVLVSLSKSGESAILTVSPFVRTVNDLLFAEISPHELAIVGKVARKLITNSEFAMIELSRRSLHRSGRGGK